MLQLYIERIHNTNIQFCNAIANVGEHFPWYNKSVKTCFQNVLK